MPVRHLRIILLAGTLALLIGIVAVVAGFIGHTRQIALDAAGSAVERAVRGAESTVNRHFLQVDGTLSALPSLVAQTLVHGADPSRQRNSDAASALLRELNGANFAFTDLVLAFPDGQPWAAAMPDSRQRPLPPAVVQAAARTPMPRMAIIGPLRNEDGGEWSLFMLREAELPGLGRMLAVAEVPVFLLTAALRPIVDLPGLALMLERPDGTLTARLPHVESWMGQPLPALEGGLPEVGTVAPRMGRLTRTMLLFAWRPTLYPEVFVTARLPMSEAERDWVRERDRVLGLAATGALLLLALGLALSSSLSQREAVEAERARSRQLLASAVETMSDGFVMFDAADRMLLCNQNYRDMYARTGDAVRPGATFEEIIRAGVARGQYPQAVGDEEGFVRTVVSLHTADRPPLERLLPDGRWILVTERRMPDGGIVGIRTDITAQKAANAQLAAARDAAAAATAAKSRFLARMSHDLRTPLNGVLGLAQALARDPGLSEAHRAQAATLEMAGRHLVSVADDVLDLATAEAGQLDLRPEPVDLPALLAQCADMVRPAAQQRGQALVTGFDPRLPTGVLADPKRLRQLLLNLLSNAVKFTPEGGSIGLHARLAGEPDALGRLPVRLEVRDTGPGVPEASREAVFGDFVRLDADRRRDGTGLGLAIARYVAERMGGRLACLPNAEAATGTLFAAELPLPPAELPAPAPPGQTTEPRPRRLLVADDVPANLAVARALLAPGGHEVVTVADGAQAVRAVAEASAAGTPFDVVLMDLMMPVQDGLEATRNIRALPGPASRTPVVAVSASVLAEDVAACRAAGMDAHIAKPIERESLLAVLAALDAGRPPPGPLGATPGQGPPPSLLERRAGRIAPGIPGLDPSTARGLLPGFVDEIRAALATIAEAPPAEASAALKELAGTAALLGAPRLAEAARRLLATPGQAELRRDVLALGEATLAELAAELAPRLHQPA